MNTPKTESHPKKHIDPSAPKLYQKSNPKVVREKAGVTVKVPKAKKR